MGLNHLVEDITAVRKRVVSTPGSSLCASASTPGSAPSSFQTGMKTIARAPAGSPGPAMGYRQSTSSLMSPG
jgi:hypothetical protein